jgi:3-oxoacyl-[acyl-carrier protein] reductase
MSYLENTFGLNRRRAIVTGAGRGIGRAIATALAGAGAEVVVHYHRSKDAAEEAASEIRSMGGQAWTEQADLTDASQARALFARVREKWDSLDVLVNNAGDLVQRCPVADFPDELLETVTKLNFYSVVYASRAAVSMLKDGTNPSIINVSSIAAHNGGSNGGAVYAATKAAVHTLTRGMAKELAPLIRVNGISPGVALTDFHRTHNTPANLEVVRNNTPLKRLGTAEDQAAAVVFLASAGASFITGEIIEINGGLWVA